MNYESSDVTAAEQKEVRGLIARNRDIYDHGAGALEHMAQKKERQIRMAAFVAKHQLSCFKCGGTFADWAKTGMGRYGRPWAICINCVRKKATPPKGAA